MKRTAITSICALATVLCTIAWADDITVRINNDPVEFNGTQPRMINGRVLVPLRGVLEKMGAYVEWVPSTQTVVASRNNMEINLPIGSRSATVNGRTVRLDVPAMTIAGTTMVPLRFLSEALGAAVSWSDTTQTVDIATNNDFRAYRRQRPTDEDNRPYRRPRPTGDDFNNSNRTVIPRGTVIPLRLDERLSSNESVAGDRFTATVESGRDDASLPDGTKIEGVVREAIPSRNGKPGVLDVDFRRFIFPDGASRAVNASLITLDDKRTTRDDSGRLTAKSQAGNERLKWVGIGAGAGLLISTLTKGNVLVDTLLGAGAGYLFNELQRKGAGNVALRPGTEIGLRIDHGFAFNPRE